MFFEIPINTTLLQAGSTKLKAESFKNVLLNTEEYLCLCKLGIASSLAMTRGEGQFENTHKYHPV